MKQILLIIAIVSLGTSFATAQMNNHFFVQPEGLGEGTSWEDAAGDLQTVLGLAQAGDIIWVATGTYYPTIGTDREATFHVPAGVRLYGGFAGTEMTLEERVLGENSSILSGAIGTEDAEDNSYTVVTFQLAGTDTRLDGFTITDGYANGITDGANPTTCGGAIYNNGENGVSSPAISNCTFTNNFSREGAAIYNYANEGEASPSISGCEFIRNRSDFNGGAIFNDGNFGTCNPTIKNCSFESNESNYGGAILNRGLYGECKPVISNSSFTNNFSVVRGGAIYNSREGRGMCDVVLESGNVFEGNASTVNGGDGVDETSNYIGF